MGALARSQVAQAKQAFALRDVALAEDLVRQDDEINRLNREVFRRAVEIGTDEDRREWAMHMMLIARALERIGDNAVDIGEQIAFVVTGLFREFSDSSRVWRDRFAESVRDRSTLRARLVLRGWTRVTPVQVVCASRRLPLSWWRDDDHAASSPLRLAVIDTDSGFLQVLTKRLEPAGWEHRVLASPVPVDTLVSMRLGALVIDLAVLGPQAWEYLDKVCHALPGLGVVVCTGQSTRRPARARACASAPTTG